MMYQLRSTEKIRIVWYRVHSVMKCSSLISQLKVCLHIVELLLLSNQESTPFHTEVWHPFGMWLQNSPSLFCVSGDGVLKTAQHYYLNFAVQNNAGTRVTLTWRDGIKEIDVDENAKNAISYNVTSYVKQLPKYNLNVVRYGTNISELINNQQNIEMSPTLTNQPGNTLTVTSSGIAGPATEYLREDPVCPPSSKSESMI